MDAARRRALTFELTAVLAWVILARLGAFLDPGLRWRVPYESEAGVYVRGAAYAIGDLCLLVYILWNSGDEWTTFGICRPRVVDVPIALGLAIALFITVWLPQALVAHPATAHWHLPDFQAGVLAYDGYLFFLCGFRAAIFQGFAISRLRELSGSDSFAVVMSAGLFASYEALRHGDGGLELGAVAGLAAGMLFVVTKRLWPVFLGFISYSVLVQCYG